MTRVILITGQAGRSLPFTLPIARSLGEVCALSIAPPGQERPLRTALSSGATRAVALWDEQLARTDYLALCQAMAAAIRRIGFDLVVCGDGRRGLIGPALADQLGVPHLSALMGAERHESRLEVTRIAWGRERRYQADLPALLSLAAPPVPLPPLGDAVDAAQVERLVLSDTDTSSAQLRWRQHFTPQAAEWTPPHRPRVFGGSAELAARLLADGLLPLREPSEGGK